jgi:hypothetical protein
VLVGAEVHWFRRSQTSNWKAEDAWQLEMGEEIEEREERVDFGGKREMFWGF